nr:cell wall-binding repeat-containing protein [Herbiconiux sp. VKM Ac-1786]
MRERRTVFGRVTTALVGILALALLTPAAPVSAAAAAETVTITGTVTGETPDGPGLAGIEVRFYLPSGPETTVTDAEGDYTFTDVPLDDAGYVIGFEPPSDSEYLRDALSPVVPVAGGPNVFDIALARGGTVSGTISLSNGQPITGGKAVITGDGSFRKDVTLDASGEYRFVGLRAGTYWINGYKEGAESASNSVRVELGQDYTLDLTLSAPRLPGSVSGRVTSESGTPLKGIEASRNGRTVVTDADGRYTISPASADTQLVSFRDPGDIYLDASTPQGVSVGQGEAVTGVDVVLQEGATISGTVLGSDGVGLPFCTVGDGQVPWAGTDSRGDYRLTGLASGTYYLWAGPYQDDVEYSGAEGPTITVQAGQHLTGVNFVLERWPLVTGTITRAPPVEGDITTFTVAFASFDPSPEEPPLVRITHPDAEGRYSLRMPPEDFQALVMAPSGPGTIATSYVPVQVWDGFRPAYFDFDSPKDPVLSGARVIRVDQDSPPTVDMTIDRGVTFASAPRPTVSGTPTVGSTLTATVAKWTPATTDVRLEWRREGVPIPGATSSTYTLTEQDLFNRVTLVVLGNDPKGFVKAASSAPVPVTQGIAGPTPTIQGTAAVGSTLTAVAGSWSPSSVELSYQWKRDGAPIDGATASTYLVQTPDAGHSLSVAVTGRKSGYPDKVLEAAAVEIAPLGPDVQRVAGPDRFAGSALVSQKVAPMTAPLVYLASGEGFADALSGSAIAAQRSAPLLLSTAASIPQVVADEIVRLRPSNIVVLGGEAALRPSVVAQLKALRPGATITRIGGADRYEMSRNLIAHPQFGAKTSTAVYVATGRNFADALSASPAAAARNVPLLLVDGSKQKLTVAETQLLTSRGVKSVTIFGGYAAVTRELGLELRARADGYTRVTGADRFEVSLAIAQEFFTKHGDTVYVATGANYPDALSGGVLAGITNGPVFLAQQNCIDAGFLTAVRDLKPKHIVILGGPAVIGFDEYPFPTCPRR